MLYAADSRGGRIVAVNLSDSSLELLYETTDDDDLRLHAIAASRRHVYFSAWNRKYDSPTALIRSMLIILKAKFHYAS